MKHVRQLCLTKLESMEEEHILSIIEPKDTSVESKPDISPTDENVEDKDSDSKMVNKVNKDSQNDKKVGLVVSDVSDDEGSGNCADLNCKPNTEASPKQASTLTLDCTDCTTPTTKSAEATVEQPKSLESSAPDIETESKPNDPNTDTEDSSSNDLMEMELRQRALESALKRANQSQTDEGSSSTIANSSNQDKKETFIDYSTQSVASDSLPRDTQGENDQNIAHEDNSEAASTADGGGLSLEQRLREKLLKSLLSKRK